jgi:hypothetical protein
MSDDAYLKERAEAEAVRKAWLDGLKAGDEVAICYPSRHACYRVESTTVTRVRVRINRRVVEFSRHLGYQRGCEQGRRRVLQVPTDEMRADLRRRSHIRAVETRLEHLEREDWKGWTAEDLETLLATLNRKGCGT